MCFGGVCDGSAGQCGCCAPFKTSVCLCLRLEPVRAGVLQVFSYVCVCMFVSDYHFL